MLERFEPAPSGSVLKIGCGAGRVRLTRLSRAVSAIDIAPDMVGYTRRAYPDVAVS